MVAWDRQKDVAALQRPRPCRLLAHGAPFFAASRGRMYRFGMPFIQKRYFIENGPRISLVGDWGPGRTWPPSGSFMPTSLAYPPMPVTQAQTPLDGSWKSNHLTKE